MSGESTSGVTDSNFPHMTPRKDGVFNYCTLVSDDLISSGPNSGQYTVTLSVTLRMSHTNKTDFFNRTEDSDTDV